MGQYYQSVIIDKKGNVNVYYNYGLKLMEHSWFMNGYVNYVCKKLFNKPSVVAWVGDYANPKEDGKQFEKLIEIGQKRGKQVSDATGFNSLGLCMVNHTKKQFLNMWAYYNKIIKQQNDDNLGWVVHPLPLLTAIGNGKGGGDYYKHNPNYDKVGIWAGDTIEFMTWEKFDKINKKHLYSEVFFSFSED